MKKLIFALITTAAVCLLFCASPEIAGTGVKDAYPVSVQVLAKAQASSTYHITITGPRMEQIGPDKYDGGQPIEIYIPVGANRRIYLERYDAQRLLTDTGSVITAIGSGMNEIPQNSVTIALKSALRTYTVTFNSRSDSSVAPQTPDSGSLATEPGVPVLSGYSFDGWYRDSASVNAWSFASDRVVRDTTLYAKWTRDPPDTYPAPRISSIIAGNTKVTVAWDTTTGATSYNLYYQAGSSVDKTGSKLIGVTSPASALGLTNGTLYAFAVAAVTPGGETSLSDIQTTTPQAPLIATPNISAVSAGNGKVTLTWNSVTGATSYNLYYKAGATVDKSGTRVTGVTTSAEVSGLTNGTQYAFAVSAVGENGESDLSIVQTATPQAPVLGAPVISSVTAANAKVTVSWGSVAGALSYNLYYKAGSTVDTTGTKLTSVTSSSDITGLTNGTQYAFAVTVMSATGESDLSVIQTATPLLPLLSAPVIVSANADDAKVTVAWNSIPGATSFTIYYKAGSTVDKTGTKLTNATSPSDITGLTNGTRYAFAVSATNPGGESDLSIIQTATPQAPVSGAPVISSASPGDTKVTVAWAPVSDATTYNLYYAAGSVVDTTGTKMSGVASPADVLDLVNGTQYAFAVTAVTAAGESGLSVVQTAIPQALLPSPPVISTASAGDGNVTVSWAAVTGELSYNLYYKSGAMVDKSGTRITGVTSPAEVVGLQNGTQYAFALSSVNGAGESGLSMLQTATPQVLPPGAPAISSLSPGISKVTVAWATVSGATSYTLYYQAGAVVDKSGSKMVGVTSPSDVVGLTNGTQYAFALSAINAGGESALSMVQTAAPRESVPVAPVIASAIVGNAQVTVTWGSVNGATSYTLYYAAGATVDKSGTKLSGVTSPYDVTGLTNGTQYAFVLSATNAGGESGLSLVETAMPQVPAPGAPGITSVTSGNGKVTLAWSTVTNATGYNVYYAAGGSVDKSGTKLPGVTTPTDVTGLTNGTLYAFAVSALTAGGESALSAVQTATPLISPNTAKALTSFSFTNPAIVGTINEAAKTVAVTVPFGANVTALVPTFVSSGASVNVGSAVQTSGATANNFTSPVTYTVTADDAGTQDYLVTVSVAAPSSNASLSALSVSQDSISPAFSYATLSYTVNVANSVTSIIITGTRNDANATLSSNSGVAQNLAVGVNTITLTVTAQDGTTTKSYVVSVNRAASSNADLSALSVNPGSISPAFSFETLSYTVNVANSVTSIIITGTRNDANATLSSNSGVAQSLAVGVNTITLTVTAQDGTTAKDYVVTVNRAAQPVTFSGLSPNGASNSVTTTALTLSFDVDPTSLAAGDITVTGATKGALTGTGLTRTLAISGITVANGATVSVAVASPAGFAITETPRTVAVYKAPVAITTAAILGVTVPVTGAPPVTTITSTAQYTGTVAWSGSPTTFAAVTVYTATITLTAKTGFTFSGVAQNFFSVAGTTSVSNPANTGLVTAAFPATGMLPPNITQHPISKTCPVNDSVTFTVGATGTGLSYLWQKLNGSTFENIQNATGISYSPPAVTVDDTVGARTYRCVVSNAAGSVTSNSATLAVSTLTDVDGNVYHQVKIGSQVWTVENLRVTRYNDGTTTIPKDTSTATWANATTPKYCYYNNATNADTIKKYGALYNWFVVAPTNPNQIAPSGWRVPTDADWSVLSDYLGGDAGLKMKTTGTADWSAPNAGATNSSGFSALPGGYRHFDGNFNYQSYYGRWWSATEYDASYAYYRYLDYNFESLYRGSLNKSWGFSVRLLRDH